MDNIASESHAGKECTPVARSRRRRQWPPQELFLPALESPASMADGVLQSPGEHNPTQRSGHRGNPLTRHQNSWLAVSGVEPSPRFLKGARILFARDIPHVNIGLAGVDEAGAVLTIDREMAVAKCVMKQGVGLRDIPNQGVNE
jgi:hypothetical protein